jgi:hypothetical protein
MHRLPALAFLLLTACASHYTQDRLDKAAQIRVGMAQAAVEELLGPPAQIETLQAMTALHYCRTGYFTDDFIVIFLDEGKVAAVKEYQVNFRQGSITPDCMDNIRPFNFSSAGMTFPE